MVAGVTQEGEQQHLRACHCVRVSVRAWQARPFRKPKRRSCCPDGRMGACRLMG